jgi:hypothetical protein
MSRALFIAITLLAASLLALACGGEGERPDRDLTPALQNLEILPNPVDIGSQTAFLASFTDHDGDMAGAQVMLEVETEDDEQIIQLPALDVKITGTTAGSISFRVAIRDDYQGTCRLIVIDEAGHISEDVEEFLFVNLVPGQLETQ